MDDFSREQLADFICGDDREKYPVYRTSTQLTHFFERAGTPRFVHDGSTRKWWVLEALRRCDGKELASVIRRLASPKEYGGDPELIRKAVVRLNAILGVENLRVELDGAEPKIGRIRTRPTYDTTPDQELKPLPPPDFTALALAPGLGTLLAVRWADAQRCVDAKAYLAGIIMMGSLLEGMLLGLLQ